ncbi:MAG TPA: TatD family hydrolase [Gemmatimonadaceae bacterium]|nr:TatD family hydrolase [Gemmatimonadaceae bacterium]
MASEDIGIPAFADSHAHLADPAFAGDRDEVIARARVAGAAAVISIGSGSGTEDVLGAAQASAAIARAHPGFVWFTAGVHPHDALGFDSTRDIAELRALHKAGAVAIGECGLDYHYDNSPRAEQRLAFDAQIELASALQIPLVVHTRDAEDDTKSFISAAENAGVTGVLHCYTGSHALAQHALAAGWFVSFSGIITFQKWDDNDLIRMIPAARILAESDSPYLAPVPTRGKRNEPAWVRHTVERLAEVRGVQLDAMCSTILANTRQFFRLASETTGEITLPAIQH